MPEQAKSGWLDRLRERRRARRERSVDRQRHREEHQRDLERQGKAAPRVDVEAGGSP
jgi:hypothetical protein